MVFWGTAELTPLAHAFAAWVRTSEHLMKLAGDGGLREFDWVGVVGFMQEMNGPGSSCR